MTLSSGVARATSFQTPRASISRETICSLCRSRYSRSSNSLTAREFELLEYLLRHKEQIVSREMLARGVWKEVARATPLDNVMDVHIKRLRRKVDEPFDRKLIRSE